MKEVTIIIAEHNEGDQLKDTLESLYSTSDASRYKVIVVSDGSEVKPGIIGDVTHVVLPKRMGVGAAFDMGALYADTPYMIIMGSDIRFKDNGYLDKMIDVLRHPDNSKSLICTTNLAINNNQMDVNAKKIMKRYGASLCFFLKAKDLPPRGVIMGRLQGDKAVNNYRNILEAKWQRKMDETTYELPCILGAFYGVHTEWYKHIDGFRGHRYWGTLEPFISLKSWFAGGDCKIATDIETAHIFKVRSSHVTRGSDLVYNKIAVSEILFSDEVADIFIKFLLTNPDVRAAKELIKRDREVIDACRVRFRKIKERDIYWFRDKFGFKDYDLL